jgi:hypothetical protein
MLTATGVIQEEPGERRAPIFEHASLPRFAPEAHQANRALVDLLNVIGQRKNATAA